MRGLTAVLMLVVVNVYGSVDPGLQFIKNKNQWPSRVHYSARIPGGRMNLENGRFVYCFIDEQKITDAHQHSHDGDERPEVKSESVDGNAVFVNCGGSNSSSTPIPFGRSITYYNYFLDRDSSRWASRAFAYQGVYYRDFYAGVNLKVYSEGSHAKYDFIVAPSADPSQIVFTYAGADKIQFDGKESNVVVKVATITEQSPVAFQWIDGKQVFVKCVYQVNGERVSFQFPEGYDRCYELVIDPLLIYSTFYGSTDDNWGSTAKPVERGTL